MLAVNISILELGFEITQETVKDAPRLTQAFFKNSTLMHLKIGSSQFTDSLQKRLLLIVEANRYISDNQLKFQASDTETKLPNHIRAIVREKLGLGVEEHTTQELLQTTQSVTGGRGNSKHKFVPYDPYGELEVGTDEAITYYDQEESLQAAYPSMNDIIALSSNRAHHTQRTSQQHKMEETKTHSTYDNPRSARISFFPGSQLPSLSLS